jgi:hypothetical protein
MPPSPSLPPTPPSGAIIELTGDAPKIIFGTIESPICELSLDRTNGRLDSTCSLNTGRRLDEIYLSKQEHELTHVKTELEDVKRQLLEMRNLVYKHMQPLSQDADAPGGHDELA